MNLKKTILNAIATKEPYVLSKGAGFFDGNYDWHSSVHAHWAISCMDPDFKIPVDIIEAELKYLKNNPGFETPYGRAWLTLLLKNLDYRSSLNEELIQWLRNSPFPKNESDFCGTHNSWLFCFFLMLLSSPQYFEELLEIKNKKITPLKKQLYSFDQEKQGDHWNFINPIALTATVDLLTNEQPPNSAIENILQTSTQFINTEFKKLARADAHMPGRYAMLLWPLALLKHQNFDSVLDKFETSPQIWRDNFEWFSHWVPQYIYMGIYLKNRPQLRSELE